MTESIFDLSNIIFELSISLGLPYKLIIRLIFTVRNIQQCITCQINYGEILRKTFCSYSPMKSSAKKIDVFALPGQMIYFVWRAIISISSRNLRSLSWENTISSHEWLVFIRASFPSRGKKLLWRKKDLFAQE